MVLFDGEECDLWYMSRYGKYIYEPDNQILDIAYEQNGDSLYVLFKDDSHIYRYDNIGGTADS